MKKLSLVTLSVLVAGIAFANALFVPFFTDSETAALLSDNTKRSTRTFISIKNVSAETQTVWLQYFDNNGANVTPAANTFTLGAGLSVSWGPALATYANCGEGTAGTPSCIWISNMTTGTSGSATISFLGATDDVTAVVGRVQGSSKEFGGSSVGRDSYGLNLGAAVE